MGVKVVMLQIIAQALGMVLASLAAAMLLSWCAWSLFKLSHHPRWGPPIVLAVLVAAFGEKLATSEFLRRTLVVAILASAALWVVGRDRSPRTEAKPMSDIANDEPSPICHSDVDHPTYPAIAACMGEARPPSRAEIRKVARRIRRETYPDQPMDRLLRRTILRAALVELAASSNPCKGRFPGRRSPR